MSTFNYVVITFFSILAAGGIAALCFLAYKLMVGTADRVTAIAGGRRETKARARAAPVESRQQVPTAPRAAPSSVWSSPSIVVMVLVGLKMAAIVALVVAGHPVWAFIILFFVDTNAKGGSSDDDDD